MSSSRLINDETLTNMTTAELKQLLEQGVITAEEHLELKCKRRRLQNRKYARTCAKKKQTEIARLAKDISEEEAEIELLKNQLSRVNISIERVQKQVRAVKNASKYLCADPFISANRDIFPNENSINEPRSIKILDNKGRQTGCAYLSQDYRDSMLNSSKKCSMETGRSLYDNDGNMSPWMEAPGPSHVSSSNPHFVRPVGGGYDSACRGVFYS